MVDKRLKSVCAVGLYAPRGVFLAKYLKGALYLAVYVID